MYLGSGGSPLLENRDWKVVFLPCVHWGGLMGLAIRVDTIPGKTTALNFHNSVMIEEST